MDNCLTFSSSFFFSPSLQHGQQLQIVQSVGESPSTTTISESTKLELLEILLHVSDISNPARTFNISEKWALLISEEFFRQGDTEAKRGMDISPLCDRNNTKINESQIGFITYVVAPLFVAWSKLVPEISICLQTMEESKKLWKDYKKSQ